MRKDEMKWLLDKIVELTERNTRQKLLLDQQQREIERLEQRNKLLAMQQKAG